MPTENGLIIKKVDLKRCGHVIDLHMPKGHDPEEKLFARIRYDKDLKKWCAKERKFRVSAIDEDDAIRLVDDEYARYRRQQDHS